MILIATLGLLIPGYLLARALRSPVPWAVAFPLSALVLTEVVIAYTLVGIPLRFSYVLDAILVVVIVCLVVELRRKPESNELPDSGEIQAPSKLFVVLALILVGLVMLGIQVRTSSYVLSGPDTALRWDALPRLMLKYESLSYYPPRTAEDFSKYFVPDSFPPLVMTVYWWLYAALGSAVPKNTSIAISLQAISCFALAFYAARMLFGVAGGVLTLIVLSTSALFLQGMAIGQENGFTAISYAGQLLFAFAALREPKANLVVMAGLFAGLGALAREYGPILAISGFAVLACRRETLRLLPLFCIVCAACAGPWYVRNWILTGNPVYPVDLGLGWPVNPVLEGFLAAYRTIYAVSNFPARYWFLIAKVLLIGAPLALLVGIPGLVAAKKSRIALAISALVAFALWFMSIPHTSGGIAYTWRFLTPAWVVLSIAAGALGSLLLPTLEPRKKLIQAIAILACVISGGYAVLCCWIEPLEVNELGTSAFVRADPLDFYDVQRFLATQLEASDLPPLGVLTEDCNLAVTLQRFTRFRPVMVWSPEVAFVFDPALDAKEVRRRLIEKNIGLVAITYHSLNNLYLFNYPFYREDFKNWRQLLSMPDQQEIFLLPK